jgi:methyl-accepting chemotaxis protein
MDTAAGSTTSPPAPLPKRRVRNYLLDSGLQLRLASYLVLVAALLSAGLGYLLWRAYRETSRVVELSAPEIGASIAALLAREDQLRIVVIAGALVVVLVCLLGAAVVVTHRIAGPAYALRQACRHVAEGSLVTPRPLRARDLLGDLGEEMAAMVGALRDREERERDGIARAAAVLRDPASDAAARAAAVDALARLAEEKERRLSS